MEISKLADMLVSEASANMCSFEDAWNYYMDDSITKNNDFREVVVYIQNKIKLANTMK